MKQNKLGVAVGAAVVVGLAGAAQAANPFGAVELAPLQVAAAAEGQCGEAKCGANKPRAKSTAEPRAAEAKCGAAKTAQPMPAEAKCGADKGNAPAPAEAKCGAKQ